MQRYFFIHVMKTGGGTLKSHVQTNFARDVVYPDTRRDPFGSYVSIERLDALPDERRSQITAYIGHFPFCVSDVGGTDVTRLTILRHPVDRTVSLLRREQVMRQPDRSLEEIYDDPDYFRGYVENHQTKIFSMRRSDQPEDYTSVIDLDQDRLAEAKRNLSRVDVVGVQERFDAFLSALEHQLGWTIGPVEDRHVGTRQAVPDSLVRRIDRACQLDLELYEFARTELAV